MCLLTLVDHPRAILRDTSDGIDMRASIYHHAMHRRPGYNADDFARHMMCVVGRPQLIAVNGRPC